MIAWKLTTDFNEQYHLFFEKIKTDYILEAYICTCGHTDFIIKHPEQKPKYVCKECENTKFYDANSAWRNIEQFLYRTRGLKLSYGYDIKKNNESIIVNYFVEIPNTIDFLCSKVLCSKKPVYSLILTSNGDLQEDYLLNFEKKISLKMKKNLTMYINKNSCFNIPDVGDKNLTLTMASFFLKNKHLRDFDFYYWSDIDKLEAEAIYINDALQLISNFPKEKSIKKAVYQNYINQLDENGRFDSSFIEAFSNNIQDVNILSKLLKLKLEYSMYSNIDKEGLDEIIVFLKRYYSEKQILKLFSSDEFNSNKYLFVDAIREFNYDKDVIENKFRKVSCKVQALHDEFVRCLREFRYNIIQNKKFAYSKKDKEACTLANTYQVKLPGNGKVLFDWADELHNCMTSYYNMIEDSTTIIYGFFQADILVFAVQISDEKVVQASGKYNADLTVKENDILTKWFELFFQEDKQMIENVA